MNAKLPVISGGMLEFMLGIGHRQRSQQLTDHLSNTYPTLIGCGLCLGHPRDAGKLVIDYCLHASNLFLQQGEIGSTVCHTQSQYGKGCLQAV